MRDDNGNPKFGINPWPEERYGEFYSGDSYIVLETTKDEDSDKLHFDIYFWIGEHSTQVSFMLDQVGFFSRNHFSFSRRIPFCTLGRVWSSSLQSCRAGCTS